MSRTASQIVKMSTARLSVNACKKVGVPNGIRTYVKKGERFISDISISAAFYCGTNQSALSYNYPGHNCKYRQRTE